MKPDSTQDPKADSNEEPSGDENNSSFLSAMYSESELSDSEETPAKAQC